MLIDVYESRTSRLKFLSVEHGVDPGTLTMIPDADLQATNLKLFKERLEIRPGELRAAMDAADIIGQIETQGFALHSATITTSIR